MRRDPTLITCVWTLVRVRASLKLRGLGPTVRRLRTRVEQRPVVAGADDEVVYASAVKVATVAAVFPGRAICLEQSITLFALLRARGIDVRMRLGVRSLPFNAHAWVEYGGVPVHEDAEHLRQFAPLPDFPR